MEIERYRELAACLPGLVPDMGEAWERLAEIFEHQVFELYSRHEAHGEENFYIPYMMNDALECCLKFQNCSMTGRYLPEYPGEVSGELIREGNRNAVVVRQGEQVFTLWFEHLQLITNGYSYHQIGHFWVKGQEQWRQLVYMAGTIYDKYEYLGAGMLNPLEKELTALMEFAPFRFWSPIRESLEGSYEDTPRGMEYMKKLALEAGDRSFARLLCLYEKLSGSWTAKFVSARMNVPKREKLYRLIRQKIEEASSQYPARDYGETMNENICQRRKAVERFLKSRGFQGEYPFFWKKEIQILAAEEHPFTMLEEESFHFRIQFMVSTGKLPEGGVNSGFFKGRHREGRIEKSLDFLTENGAS